MCGIMVLLRHHANLQQTSHYQLLLRDKLFHQKSTIERGINIKKKNK